MTKPKPHQTGKRDPQSQESRQPWRVDQTSRRTFFREQAAKRAANGEAPRTGGKPCDPNSLASTRPWEALGISRTTWVRRRAKQAAEASATKREARHA
jgi:hypothetical protein